MEQTTTYFSTQRFLPRAGLAGICMLLLLLTSTAVVPVAANSPESLVAVTGEQRQWHRVALTFNGPNTGEKATYNPFTNFRLNVTFTNGNRSYTVPGFYAADGNAANTGATGGNKWRVYFTPDATGTWNYTVSFRQGQNVAISLDPNAGQAVESLDGLTGSFQVFQTNKTGRDFRAHGMLRYNGTHYLRFAGSGERFLKNGADSPENFFGYADFDGTYDTGGLIDDFLHEYQPHVQDWKPGDPQWKNGKGRGIIGALNYLASQGGNSVYLITYNIDGGDGGDTWPWTSDTEREVFDVSKLDQWEIVFSHMTKLGIQIHMLLTEIENDEELGPTSGLNDIRKLYYRELIARFAHHPVLQWNLGEENDNSVSEIEDFSFYIRSLDPYNHPITVHTYGDIPVQYYQDLLGSPNLELTSIHGFADKYNEWAIELREQSTQAGRPWVIYGDEQGPEVLADMSNVDQLVSDAMWGNLLGGGAGVEWYFGYQGDDFGDVQSEDWRVAEPLWRQANVAVRFFQNSLPYWEMQPRNDLIVDGNADDALLAKVGSIYVVRWDDWYSSFSPRVNVGNTNKSFTVRWLDPRGNGRLETSNVPVVTGPGPVNIGKPPRDATREWVTVLSQVTISTYDVNVDGKVSPEDAIYVLNRRGASGSGLAADVNNDGVVNNFDVRLILQNLGP